MAEHQAWTQRARPQRMRLLIHRGYERLARYSLLHMLKTWVRLPISCLLDRRVSPLIPQFFSGIAEEW
jgi:hypothetical protein